MRKYSNTVKNWPRFVVGIIILFHLILIRWVSGEILDVFKKYPKYRITGARIPRNLVNCFLRQRPMHCRKLWRLVYERHSRFAWLWLAWSHGGSSDRKFRSNCCAVGKSAARQSSGGSASPVRSDAGAPLPPKWRRLIKWSAANAGLAVVNSRPCRVALSTDRRRQTLLGCNYH